jgi:hypothetical protein
MELAKSTFGPTKSPLTTLPKPIPIRRWGMAAEPFAGGAEPTPDAKPRN